MDDLWTRLEVIQKAKGGNRKVMMDLQKRAPHFGFEVVNSKPCSVIIRDRSLYVQLALSISEAVNRLFALSIHQAQLIQQLLAWAGAQDAQAEIPWMRMVLRKKV